ncbi:RluA family pseudouridine synthase [Flaviaesturariibacter aridisoli]|uniref:Pseudouridine synthase n=1 Tax=Flaviaesturariibacter aridisoli TaxID=2545761 RepID=A0A4R4E7B6_9BACT|nr:RluA family pseudouridine synthase [Flaviaesturariibacter aridisoli]TCZ74977.1 RluA family pseudouridine synthase [Flaviaesturariibacter aridisoli]
MSFKISDAILYEDDYLVAVNKPSGLLTIPDREAVPGLRNLLQERYGAIFTVHRLDRDTSGLVIFAKTEEAHRHFSKQFEERSTRKIYNGLVLGTPFQSEGVVNEPIAEHPTKKGIMTVWRKGKESITEFTVLERFRLYSWMQFRILTGRTHQIRVHMKHLGHPVVCDPLYGDGKPVLLSEFRKKFTLGKFEEERPLLNRLALHAAALTIQNVDGKELTIEAPLPKDMRATLQQLRK